MIMFSILAVFPNEDEIKLVFFHIDDDIGGDRNITVMALIRNVLPIHQFRSTPTCSYNNKLIHCRYLYNVVTKQIYLGI